SNGSNISTWSDKSGSGNDVSQETTDNQPDYDTTGLNSKPSILFTGSEYLRDESGSSSFVFDGTADYSIFVVIKSNDLTTDQRILARWGSGNGQYALSTLSSSKIHFYRNVSPWGMVHNTIINTSNAYYISYTYDSTNINGYINGIGQSATYGAVATSSYKLTLGARSDLVEHFKGYISEVLFYNKALNSTEINEVEVYLSNKWGI
ncbi:LamG-like jellyroll fold domain-containing protein, partial [Pseudomonadota bacterium]